MAVVWTKGPQVTNRDATPPVINDGRTQRGSRKTAIAFVTATNGDSANSVYSLVEVPSSARIVDIRLTNEALGAAATVNVGAFQNSVDTLASGATKPGGARVGANTSFFASGVAVTAAAIDAAVLNQAGNNTLDVRMQPLWQALGFTADPMKTFDIGIQVNVAIAATGKIGLVVDYVDNSN